MHVCVVLGTKVRKRVKGTVKLQSFRALVVSFKKFSKKKLILLPPKLQIFSPLSVVRVTACCLCAYSRLCCQQPPFIWLVLF